MPMDLRFTDYKTVKEAADEWNVTERWVAMSCKSGRVSGAIKKGMIWLIPNDAIKPADGRKNNRRQPKNGTSALGIPCESSGKK